MPNNTIMRTKTLGAAYSALAATPVIFSGTITAGLNNVGTAYLKGDTGDDVPLAPGEFHEFHHVDLSLIEVKGTVNDVVTSIGGSW